MTSSRYSRRPLAAGTSSSSSSAAAFSPTLPPVVLEFGSSHLRFGFAGESAPRHIIRTPIELSTTALSGRSSHAEWDGILYPLLSHILTDLLLLKNIKSRPLVVVESSLVSCAAVRNAICRSALSLLNVPTVSFVPGAAAVALPFGLGLSRGIVVDIGRLEGRIVVVAGEDGRPLLNTFRASPCGIEQLAENVMSRHNAMNSKTHEITTIDEVMPILNQHFSPATESLSPSADKQSKQMFDSETIESCIHETFFDVRNPESLIRSFFSVLSMCPIDLRRAVVRNVLFVGGTVDFFGNMERRFLSAISEAFGPSGDDLDVSSSGLDGFHSLRPLLMDGGLSIVHPLPFAPSVFTWTAASVLANTAGTALAAFDHIQNKDFVQLQNTDPNSDACRDFLSVA